MKKRSVPCETQEKSALKTKVVDPSKKVKCVNKGCKRLRRPGQWDCRACHAADVRARRKRDGENRAELATEFRQIADRVTEFLAGKRQA